MSGNCTTARYGRHQLHRVVATEDLCHAMLWVADGLVDATLDVHHAVIDQLGHLVGHVAVKLGVPMSGGAPVTGGVHCELGTRVPKEDLGVVDVS